MTPSSGLGIPRPYPLADLVSAARCASAYELGRRIGVSGTTLQQALTLGLSELQADRWAVRAGLVATVVWPEMLERAIADFNDYKDEKERKGKEARRAYRRAYYLRNREAELQRERDRYQRERDFKIRASRTYYRLNRERVIARVVERERRLRREARTPHRAPETVDVRRREEAA